MCDQRFKIDMCEELPQKKADLFCVSIRELTKHNKHVFKRTNVCLCPYLCVISKSVFKSVFFCQPWFG